MSPRCLGAAVGVVGLVVRRADQVCQVLAPVALDLEQVLEPLGHTCRQAALLLDVGVDRLLDPDLLIQGGLVQFLIGQRAAVLALGFLDVV